MGNDTRDKAAGRLTHLTPRQRQVLQLAAGGANNEEIATVLGVHSYTVKRHLNSIASRYWLLGYGRTLGWVGGGAQQDNNVWAGQLAEVHYDRQIPQQEPPRYCS